MTPPETKQKDPAPATRTSPVALPVLKGHKTTVRPSKMSKRRAASLILVHLIMIAHGIQWLITGRTLSPIEPSEAMYTLNDGHLNAGFIFFAVSILATLIFGRYVCGWGCHVIAYQDLCAHLLKKIRVKPKPFRARLLVYAPLALAIYMFVWPTAYRLYIGAPAPPTENHLMTTEFWKTFPGLFIAILTLIVCGFAIVYFLGAKGFCTYACPYGGFFAVADQVAPGKIRVNDDCEHCGHCTAICSSNVRVHEEVATYGMVIDPGCMKCMDCVTVCPNNALSFGFGKPAITATASTTPKPRQFDFTIAEELLMIAVGLAAILAYRGLYNQIPLLLAMGMAAITTFALAKTWRLVAATNVRFQNLQLKRGKRLTKTGAACALFSLALIAFLAHCGLIQYRFFKAHNEFQALQIPDTIWSPGNNWWETAQDQTKKRVTKTIDQLESVNQLGLTKTPSAMEDLVWLYLASKDTHAAEITARQLIELGPNKPDFHRGFAGILRQQQRYAEAENAYKKSLDVKPSFATARIELARMLQSQNRPDHALEILRAGPQEKNDAAKWPLHASELLASLGRFDEARAELAHYLDEDPENENLLAAMGFIEARAGNTTQGINYWKRSLKRNPNRTNIRYNLAMALLSQDRIDDGIDHLKQLVDTHPDFVQAQYNLAVALYMNSQPDKARPHAEKARELAPNDQKIKSFNELLQSKTQPEPQNPQP